MRLGLGLGLATRRPIFGGGRGPEMVTTPVGTGWTPSDGTVTVSAGKVSFLNSAANAGAFIAVAGLKDNTPYEVTYRMINRTGGNARVQVSGATAAHQGTTASHSANGTFTEIVTTNGAGANALRVNVQVNGAGSINTLEVDFVSVKEVLS